MIIKTANIVSRASAGLPSPVSMTEAIIITSMVMADNVRISVPKGSPKRTARLSAWRTTAKADAKMTQKSHARMRVNHSG